MIASEHQFIEILAKKASFEQKPELLARLKFSGKSVRTNFGLIVQNSKRRYIGASTFGAHKAPF